MIKRQAEKDGRVPRLHPVVRIGHRAGGRAQRVRHLREGDPAGPVMAAVPARRRHAAIARGPDGRASRQEQRHLARRIRHHDVLRGAADARHGLARLLQRPGPVQRVQPGGRRVARCQAGHLHRQHRAGGRLRGIAARCLQIRHHRPMAGLTHPQHRVRLAPHGDPFLAQREGAGAVRGLVARHAREALDEDILRVGMGGGEAPGQPVAAADHHEGHAGRRGPGQEASLRQLDPRQIPQDRRAEAEMRIRGQQGAPRGGAPRRHGPGVGGAVRQGRIAREFRQGGQQPPQRLRAGRARRRHGRGHLGAAGGFVGGPELPDPFRRQAARQPGTGQLRAPVAGQVEPHQLAPEQAVGGPPGFRRTQQQEFRRGEAAAFGDPGIHPGGIGLQQAPRFRRLGREVGLGPPGEAQHAHEAVGPQRRRAGDRGEAARGAAAHQVHLEHPVTGMQQAQRHGRIHLVPRGDAGDALGIEGHLHRGGKPRQRKPRLARRQRPPQASRQRGEGQHHEQGQDREGGAQRAARRAVAGMVRVAHARAVWARTARAPGVPAMVKPGAAGGAGVRPLPALDGT
ncbi:hypothetical protein ROTAS13_03646 [Roseomonas sp. TAS13]|nr:hypothetical protein ROTAS13_03646 [Roseomonas sp. TAS13]